MIGHVGSSAGVSFGDHGVGVPMDGPLPPPAGPAAPNPIVDEIGAGILGELEGANAENRARIAISDAGAGAAAAAAGAH